MKIFSSFTIITALSLLLFLCSCSKTKNSSDVFINDNTADSLQKEDNPIVENIQPISNVSEETVNVPLQSQSSIPNANPPHGQPGHRCDIPVGASLNSAPAQNNPTPQVSSPTVQKIEIPELKINHQESGATANSGKINPPHGEPDHRCDIQVGQPLP